MTKYIALLALLGMAGGGIYWQYQGGIPPQPNVQTAQLSNACPSPPAG